MSTDEERRRTRRDLDSILDAALDELDGDSDSDNDDGCDAAAVPTENGAAAAATGGDGGDSAAAGVPYSLEYLASDAHRRQAEASANKARERPRFGPEPPPDGPLAPPLPPDLAAGEAELAASLEGMMKQFAEGLGDMDGSGGGDEAEGALDDMFRQMMMGGPEAEARAAGAAGASHNASSASPGGKINEPAAKKGNGTDGKREPNVDESISRLLDGIDRASTAPLPPAMPPDMPDIDPAQFEKMGEEMMSSIMGEFEKMGNADDGNDVVDGVMKQLLDKDLMYEPMKEVCTRFPKWLAEHKETLSEEEYRKYGTQYQYFQKIVHVYETDPGNFARLMELMQDIQEYGQPPVEIIKDLAPELEFDEEGMPVMDPSGMMGGMPGMPGMMPPGMPFPGNEQCCIS